MAVGTIEANMNTLKRILGTAVLLAAAALASAQGRGSNPIFDDLTKLSVLSEMEQVLVSVAFVPGVDFATWPVMIAKYEDQIAASESPAQFTRLVNRALMEFGFSHILLFSPVAAGRRNTNQMVGIGVRIQLEEGGIRVIRVFEDGAAFGAGVKVGDLIFEADGHAIRGPSDLAGDEGEPVMIKIDRDGETVEIEIVRKKFRTVVPEELEWPEEKVAHLIIPTFDAAYDQARVRDLMKDAEEADLLILDVRGNGGGRVFNLIHLSSFFL
ncbi:MAG: PDZ domain-containing protein, partial [Armatimonadetes bacterium]|nr:PDZ domain-containing protein [Armatimonadota bacterium]